jgi:iron complex outermembrane receptor protein/vitamin B12 transporter
VIQRPEFRNQAFLVDALRQAPGVFVVQTGMYGGVTSLFIRGGPSTANRVLLDGTPVEDIGGRFDFSNLSSTGTSQMEVYRGPNSVLYGSDAAAGVVSVTTPEGSTSFPSLFYEGDAGNLQTWRNELQLGGTRNKLDYYAGASYFESSNALPQDEYRNLSEVLNLGYAISSATTVRVTGRNGDSSVGLPNAFDFYGLANDGKQADQDTYFTGLIDQQTNLKWHNSVQYGLTRKREQSQQWYPAGNFIDGNYYGDIVDIRGANGYSSIGQALLNYSTENFGVYPNKTEIASNRDQVYAQSSYQLTPHIAALFGFRYEDERGEARSAAYFYNYNLERSNYDYTGEIKGDLFKSRLFYSFGGGVEKNELIGTVGEPSIGLTFYPVRPGNGYAHGTKLTFQFSKGVQEPDIFSQVDSLYELLIQNGEADVATRYDIRPINGENSRTYDGGVEQSFFNQRLLFNATYFHNEFGSQIEFVSAKLLPELGVNQNVATTISNIFGGADVNTLAYRAQGIETQVQSQITSRIFIRGGYTYTDPVVQRSFSSSAVGPTINPLFPRIPIGASSPLIGARPFRLAPNVGFAGISFTGVRLYLNLQGSFASRSDDSTFLAGADLESGNTLLLPNRNLDAAYARIDLGGSYELTNYLSLYAQANNLVNDQHIGPIGYPSLPLTLRVGLRFQLGHQHK